MLMLLEPFYGGSHKQLLDIIQNSSVGAEVQMHTLPAKKWHWRARTAALKFSQTIPRRLKEDHSPDKVVLFASSVLNLCELIALRPDLSGCKKILYFHENQLNYPRQLEKERDFQYGYKEILSALVADIVCFNSKYNMESFLANISKHLKLQPDCRPDCSSICEEIATKSRVVYFPVFDQLKSITQLKAAGRQRDRSRPLHIVWPHRWEHDKNPEAFFRALFTLDEEGASFRVSVLGESYTDVPAVFAEAKDRLKDKIVQFGRLESRDDYLAALADSDVVVSTAVHEFFGVSVLEACYQGCYPLVPNRLAYPEIYPTECLYNTDNQMLKKLRTLSERPYLAQEWMAKIDINFEQFSSINLMDVIKI